MTTLETGSVISGVVILIGIILFRLVLHSLDKRDKRLKTYLEEKKYTHPHATTNNIKS
tara:strand:+ start:44 stop:217 length:174 start_codon:yes stop_codon:yes gene_type:complete